MAHLGRTSRPACLLFFAAFFPLASTRDARAQASDSTLDFAQLKVKQALASVKDSTVNQDPKSGQVIRSLAASGDKDVIPIFQKLRQSKSLDTQIFGMLTSALIAKQAGIDPESKEFNYVDLKLVFSSKDIQVVGITISSLIDAQAVSVAQLREIVALAPDGFLRGLAAGELNRLKKLEDRSILTALLKDDKPAVRYYAAVTMLQGEDAAEHKAALAALMEMTAEHDARHLPTQAMMIVRMQKDKIPAGIPWITKIAGDEQSDLGLRMTAISALLSLGGADGPALLADLIQKEKDNSQQVKLGLISIEHGAMMRREMISPLTQSKSSLVKSIAAIAQKAADKTDTTADLLVLIREGHPIVLDWAMIYADHAPADVRLAVRTALIGQANIVDGERDRDYNRAVMAATRILNSDGAGGRKTLETLLKSDNRAAVEATLAGIYNSNAKDQSQLVLDSKVWDGLTRTTTTEIAANYAALILAREGHKETLAWLPGMVLGGPSRGPNFQALAGWYYAKLKNQSDAFLKNVLAD